MPCVSKINGGGVTPTDAAASLAKILRENDVITLLTCLLKEQRRTNAYLAAMTELEIEDPDIEV